MKKLKPESRKLYRETIKWHNEKFDKLCGIKKVNGKLKLFTPEAKETINLKPEITYKMKKVINSVKKAILHLNILGLLFIIACGSDNPTGSNNPPVTNNDSLMYSVDSIGIFGTGYIAKDSSWNCIGNGDSIKISFSVSTDCLIQDEAHIAVQFGDISELLTITSNNDYVFYGSLTQNTVAFMVYFNTQSLRFLRMKNIKLYKIKSVQTSL